jgi:hypothetical protein
MVSSPFCYGKNKKQPDNEMPRNLAPKIAPKIGSIWEDGTNPTSN